MEVQASCAGLPVEDDGAGRSYTGTAVEGSYAEPTAENNSAEELRGDVKRGEELREDGDRVEELRGDNRWRRGGLQGWPAA